MLLATVKQFENILFPPRCVNCSDFVQEQGGLCQSCWQELDFLIDPRCRSCGYPFAYDIAEIEMLCGSCLQNPPAFDAHRAALRYNSGCSHMIQRLKYHDRSDMIPLLARWLQRPAAEFLQKEGLIVIPVPLHPLRMLRRKYNQAALLARAFHRTQPQTSLLLDALYRLRRRPPQASLTRKERLKNMRGVFAVTPRHMPQLQHRPVLLVDDVMTTGATLNACAKTLKKAGSGPVYAVTLAHTTLE